MQEQRAVFAAYTAKLLAVSHWTQTVGTPIEQFKHPLPLLGHKGIDAHVPLFERKYPI